MPRPLDQYRIDSTQEFTQVLQDRGVKISMDGKGRYSGNIFVEERLWRTVKHEGVYLKANANAPEACRELGAYYRFYNNLRSHQALGYWALAEVFHREPWTGRKSRRIRCVHRDQCRCRWQERQNPYLVPHQSCPTNRVHRSPCHIGGGVDPTLSRRLHMSNNPPNEVVRAKAFQVVNDDGAVVAELMANEDGRPYFFLRHKDGSERLAIFIDRQGEPHIMIIGGDMETVITLGMDRFDGTDLSRPSIEIHDEDRFIRLSTRRGGPGSPGLKLEWRNNSIEIGLDPGPFMFMDKEGKDRRWKP